MSLEVKRVCASGPAPQPVISQRADSASVAFVALTSLRTVGILLGVGRKCEILNRAQIYIFCQPQFSEKYRR